MDPIESCDKRQILGVVDSSSTGTTATDNTSTTTDTSSGSRTQTRCTRPGSGAQEMDPCMTEFDQLSEENKHLKAQLSSTKSGSSISHQELYTAAVNTCHTIPALPRNDDDNDDDNDATALSRQTGSFFFDPETKSAEPVRQRSRRSGIDSVNGGRIDSAVRRHSNVDSIAAVSDIISMILAPWSSFHSSTFAPLVKYPVATRPSLAVGTGRRRRWDRRIRFRSPSETGGRSYLSQYVSSPSPRRCTPGYTCSSTPNRHNSLRLTTMHTHAH